MIKVYFETEHPSYAEEVATFVSEEVYIACLPALQDLAHKLNFDKVTESFESEAQLDTFVEVFVNGVWDTAHEDKSEPSKVVVYDKGKVYAIRRQEYDKFIDHLEETGYDCYLCPELYKHPLWNGEIEYAQDEQ